MKQKEFITLIKSIFLVLITGCLLNCAGSAPQIDIPDQPPPARTLETQPRIALVLGGGGARGYAHIGVLKVLTDAHLPIDLVVGTSVGSLVGAVYSDNGDFAQVQRSMQDANFWSFFDFSNIPNLKGIAEGYRIEKFVLAHMRSKDFNETKIKLIVSSTNLKTGDVYPIESGPIAPAIRASTAIPGLIQPVQLYGHILVDGGMVDPVPVDLAKPLHPNIIIAVDIARELPTKLPTDASGIAARSMSISRLRITAASLEGADIVIRPKVGDISDFDLAARQQLITEGEAAAKAALPAIHKLMAKRLKQE